MKGCVEFSGEHVLDTDAEFEIHRSETYKGLVHIRSCHNNKYLVLVEEYNWIVAKAEKPEEDQSMRSYTLLRPTPVDMNLQKIRPTNVRLMCLNAWTDIINKQATLKVSEFVISRKIDNIKFRLMDATI